MHVHQKLLKNFTMNFNATVNKFIKTAVPIHTYTHSSNEKEKLSLQMTRINVHSTWHRQSKVLDLQE